MLKLYSAPMTRSIRVAWLLEELGVPYDVISGEFTRTTDTFFIQQTPTGKYPTIDDDGFIMFESGAIIEYLLAKHPGSGLAPTPGTTEYGEYLQWLHFADATAFSPLGIVIWLGSYRDDAADNEAIIVDAMARARTGFAQLEDHLAERQWLLGDTFTAADIMMGFTLMAGRLTGVIGDDSPLVPYLQRGISRDAFQRALARTNPDGIPALAQAT